MKVSEKAYMAGIFDGEGCIAVDRGARGTNAFVSISVGQKRTPEGLKLVTWIRDTFGGNLTEQSNDNLGMYRWFSSDSGVTLRVLLKCLPFMQVKKRQAQLAISLLITKHKLGRVTGFGYQNTEPPEDLKNYRLLVCDAIQRLNQAIDPPAETECKELIQLGKLLVKMYGKRQSALVGL